MKSTRFLILVVAACLSGSVCARSDVIVGAPLLSMPVSLRNVAMGEVGVAFADRESYTVNPGALGVVSARPAITLGPLMWVNDLYGGSTDVYNGGGAARTNLAATAGGERISLGLAGYTTAMKLTIPADPYGTEYTDDWGNRAYHLRAGIGINGPVQVGVGTGVSYHRESAAYDNHADGWAFDFGLLARMPVAVRSADDAPNVTVTPSIGLTATNIGRDFVLPGLLPFNDTLSLPRTFRAGFGTELAIGSPRLFGGWQLLSATGGIEYERTRSMDGFAKVGGELGLVEALYLRVGYLDEGHGVNTWGFAVGSAGVTRLLVWIFGNPDGSSGLINFFATRLSINYARSHRKLEGLESDATSHGVTVTYRYGGL